MQSEISKTPIYEWRSRMGLSQRAAAGALDVTLTTYQQYERGAAFADGKPKATPAVVLLACAALEHGVAPIG